MEDDDLDSFIANIELTAPEDALAAKLTCNECGGVLEEDEDGHYVCPLCSVQAANILQLDDTELHHDDQGRPVYGQRVRIGERKSKHSVDYGWSWSTDDAINFILKLQVDALKDAKLIPEIFPDAVYNMWERFWWQSVAPHIRDEDYSENELVPISVSKALKLRDIEVLVKHKDKVMIPLHLIKGKKDIETIHQMFGIEFFTTTGGSPRVGSDSGGVTDLEDDIPSSSSNADEMVRQDVDPSEPPQAEQQDQGGTDNREEEGQGEGEGQVAAPPPADDYLKEIAKHCRGQTRNLSADSIEVLTLNRTLAFLEATSRCLDANDPLFASDLIRACNQRIIPFYGSSRLLPSNMKLDERDKLGFQKTRPPTPTQLTRTAVLLLRNIYKDKLPMIFPVPDMDVILKRFIKDMNLPKALFEAIKGKVNFNDFRATEPLVMKTSGRHRLPQYDRWAFAVLVMHLKIMFNLSDRQLIAQQNKALVVAGDDSGGNYFIFHDWIRQISLRLELILRHDPFVLYHPMNELERMVPTSQLARYLEQIVADRNHAEITLHANSLFYDDEARAELADLLHRELPPPKEVASELPTDDERLHISKVVKYPLSDAFRRTQQFWVHKLEAPECELAFGSFAEKELILINDVPAWSIFDSGRTLRSREHEMPSEWPDALTLLLHVGAFMCFCEPVDLLEEFKVVEETFHPQVRVIKRRNNALLRETQSATLNSMDSPRTYANRGRH